MTTMNEVRERHVKFSEDIYQSAYPKSSEKDRAYLIAHADKLAEALRDVLATRHTTYERYGNAVNNAYAVLKEHDA